MRKTFTEKRFFHWVDDDLSVTLRSSSASYGGGSEVLVVEPICFINEMTIKYDEGGGIIYPQIQRLQGSARCNDE